MVWMRSRAPRSGVAQLAAPRNATATKTIRVMARLVLIFVLPNAMLAWNLRADRQPPHAPALAVIIIHCEVLCAAVVPDRERARRPLHAASELGPRLMFLQKLDQRPALGFAHVFKTDRMTAAEVQRLAPGVGMRAHNGMLRLVLFRAVGVVHLHAADLAMHLGAPAAVLERRAVHADQAGEHLAHAFG